MTPPDEINEGQSGEIRLLINEPFGKGGPQNGLGPEGLSDLAPVDDVADPKYVEQLRDERWLCMDDGMEMLGGQLPGGLMITEVAGALMDDAQPPKALSQLVASTTESLSSDGLEIWVHGDTGSGKTGCAANKFMRDILKIGGHQADAIAPIVWGMLETMGLEKLLPRAQARQFCLSGGERAEDERLWDVSPTEVANIAEASGASYHELDREHKTPCTRFDLSPNIFNNHRFRKDHRSKDGLPLGAFSITLGAYRDSLAKRAEDHGHDERWVAEKVLQAAIFSVAASKKLGSPQLRLAIVG